MVTIDSITESEPYSLRKLRALRNLQNMPKRRKNTTESFARGVKKAVKNLDVAKAVREQFFQKAGAFALAGLLTLLPGAFNKEAKAAPKDGTQVASAPQELLKKEGSGTTVPVSHAPTPQAEPVDSVPFRDFQKMDPVAVGMMASRASGNTAVVVFYGDDPDMLKAIRLGASKAKDEQNAPVGVVLQAKGNNTVEYWVNGQHVDISSVVENWNELDLTTQTQVTISWANEHLLKPNDQLAEAVP